MANIDARIIVKASGTASEVPSGSDLEVAELAVNTADGLLFTKHTDNTVVTIGGGGGGGATRTSIAVATASLADQAAQNLEFAAAGKSGTFVTVETDVAAWVTFYTDTSSRTSDSARVQTVSPSPGSGVLLEVITTGAQTIRITPSVGYFNDDTVLSPNLIAKVVNISGGTAVVTTTVDVITLEA